MKELALTLEAARAETKLLEGKYGKAFLEKSLHGAAMRWRALTAPNAEELINLGMIPASIATPDMTRSLDARMDSAFANGVASCMERLAHLRRPEDDEAWKDCEAMRDNRRANARRS